MRNTAAPSHPAYIDGGIGTKKTLFVVVTVVGCIAILWPKVFYPMMFASPPPKPTSGIKDHRGGGCCDVVLNDKFLNSTPTNFGPQPYRKQLNLLTGEMTLRQERPPHSRMEAIHPAMRERGRAIPDTLTVPVIDRKKSKDPAPRIVEGRPGPIPGMRPPMGAGSMHQAQPKGAGGMGFIMPLYTVGIVVFFVYTIMKIMFKKPMPNAPYGPVQPDPKFRQEVFGQKTDDEKNPKLVVTAIQGLIDAVDDQLQVQKKKNSTIPTINKDEETHQNGISGGHTQKSPSSEQVEKENSQDNKTDAKDSDRHKREGSSDRTVTVLGMELTASCEGGHKWGGRPPTPVLFLHSTEHSNLDDDLKDLPEPQEIYLEGSLPCESQILVAEADTHAEEVIDKELNGTAEEPAVVISSKMTLSLINLNAHNEDAPDKNRISSDFSPLSDDIEIIGSEEHQGI